MSKQWYAFTGSDSQAFTLNKYRFVEDYPGGCNTGYHVCAVYAAYGGINPAIISNQLETYISRVLANGTPQPDSSIGGGKLFAYGKTTS
jgi:hypothetical protein